MAVFLNEDYENFMAFHEEEEMCEEGLRKQVREYFRGQTKGIFFNVNAQRAYFNSNVFEPVWKGISQNKEGKWVHKGVEFTDKPLPTLSNTLRAKMLFENVGNPFHIRLDECRKLGGMGCISMRMNDCHLSHLPESPMHSSMWYDNPSWRLDMWCTPNGSGLDYAIPQVRKAIMDLTEELFEIFDMDAFEIDWMRTPPFFHYGQEEEGIRYMNEIMAFAASQKKKAEERLGHRILLSARVPSRPEEALLLGLDVHYWAREKYVDMVVPCAFIGSTDGEMPIALWRKLLGDEVKLVPGMDILTRPHEGAPQPHNTAELVYGFAAAFFYQGVEDLYLFNHMDRLTGLVDKEAHKELLACIGEREKVEKCFRRHAATMVQNLLPGKRFSSLLPMAAREWWQFIRISNGGNFKEREKSILLAFESGKRLSADDFEFSVNEVITPEVTLGSPLPIAGDKLQKFVCRIPEGALKEGSSVVGFRATQKTEALLQWCEIDIAKA